MKMIRIAAASRRRSSGAITTDASMFGPETKLHLENLGPDTKLPLEAVQEELNYRAFKIGVGRDCILFALYFSFFIGILVSHSNIQTSFQMKDMLYRDIIANDKVGTLTSFENLNQPHEVYDWMNEILIPNVYRKFWYNGDMYSQEIDNTIGFQTKMIGSLRLVQTRREETYTSGFCYTSIFDKISDRCLTDNQAHNMILCDGRSCCNQGIALSPHVCCNSTGGGNSSTCSFSDVSAALSERTLGSETGYIHDFNFSLTVTEARQEVATLKQVRWIDSLTRTLDILLTAYNPNLKRFMAIDLLLETSLVGYMDGSFQIRVLDLGPYDQKSPDYDSRMAMDVIWVFLVSLLLLGNLLKTSSVLLLPGNRFRNMWEYMDMGTPIGIVVSVFDFILIGIFLEMYNHEERSHVLDTLHAYSDGGEDQPRRRFVNPAFTSYVSLSQLAELDEELYSFASILLLLHILMALHTFRVTLRAEQLMNSLGKAIPDVLGFGPLYLVIIVGYALAGYILYGSTLASFSTVSNAFFSVFQLNFGLLDITPLHEQATLGSKLYLATSLIVFTMILLNIVLSIIMRVGKINRHVFNH
mmetsp:Transcript_34500/g.55521  ORF Transcript_34500/g.55521 Transcript_34500/m.55521 type:complete len:584 (+) Transcript_34500:200-1951(+)